MEFKNKTDKRVFVIILIAFLFVLAILIFSFTPTGVEFFNKWKVALTNADINTSFEEQKKIEDTLRAYMASYEADRITWETNKNSSRSEQVELAYAALTRANRTAAVYNEYYLKNSHVWKDNVPMDIKPALPYLIEGELDSNAL